MWLDMCDEMGVLVIGGLPIECMRRWPTVTPHLRDRIENEVRSAILRDRNRACIVQWEIFNEIMREDLERLKHSTSMLARRLDPTRLILDESGGFAGGANIYLPYQFEPQVFNDVHSYPGAPLNDTSLRQVPHAFEDAGRDRSDGIAARTLHRQQDDARPLDRRFGNRLRQPAGPGGQQRAVRQGRQSVDAPYRYHKGLAESFRDV